ncbi:FKBP-type peptidyl-prolyl cis-trans isomerase [Dactylosporangium sp. CS-047395]|uniref:FKBP-type peptidyl-prolyl cis-trans isomerase n=1 Tax=Dactylosporangium sp. CS-047395 TaxID=3239936 RepID=UPI003D945F5F
MNDRATAPARLSKTQQKAAARAAQQRAAERAKRRRDWGIAGIVAVVVIVVIAGVVWLSVSANDDSTPGTAPGTGAFPPVPPGADPALSTKPTVAAGSGGLTSLVKNTLIEGTGPVTANSQTITVNYVGVSYTTGKEFDSSWSRKEAFSFALGTGNVIPGWDQGLVGIKVGSRVQLDIPSNLAYGDDASSGKPTGPLRFVVDVLGTQ